MSHGNTHDNQAHNDNDNHQKTSPSASLTHADGGDDDGDTDGQHTQKAKGAWRKAHVLTKPFTQLHKVLGHDDILCMMYCA